MRAWMASFLGALALALPAGTGAVAQTAPIRLVPVVDAGLTQPLFVTHAADGSRRLFVVERPGRVRTVAGGALLARPFLDLTGRVLSDGEEQGLLGLAFHPRYRQNGRFFVAYTRRPDGASVVAEFRAAPTDPGQALPAERVLLVVPQPFPNHNGGMLAFGSGGGRLFVGLGDGGGAGDPANRAQDPRSLLGKILRVDVDRGQPYGIPRDNPFAAGGGRGEIYAWGFRNPWRFSFDRLTAQLYVGDVGQNAVEEIDRVARGGNYGWSVMEGDRCHRPAAGCDRRGLTLPVATYANAGGRCAVTGGYVYRGAAIPGLVGTYLYGDFCSGEIFGLRAGRSARLLDTDRLVASFGEDEAGEIYVVGLGGTVDRVAPVP